MFNHQKSVDYGFFFVPSADLFCVCRQVGFSGRCFPDNYSLALEIQRIASINFRVSARLEQLGSISILNTGFGA
ncbi:hypothetical protein RV032_003786 [Vibrio cholerae]|nr:hypothetical protein [Vibrio cholerae]ELC9568285.1 hypothetical protein [Vibrio cholerae]ELK8283873.1 hypothetical protein [Vibrio cholerae]